MTEVRHRVRWGRTITPKSPDSRLIRTIHRDHDGYATFATKRDGEFRSLWSMASDHLRDWSSRHSADLGRDAFFTVNGFLAVPSKTSDGSRLPRPVRTADRIRWLNAAFVDIDLRPGDGLTRQAVIRTVRTAVEEGLMPPPSIVVHSGRGLWLLWLLRSESGNGPVQAWPEVVIQWSRIQSAIHNRIRAMGFPADPNSKDCSRLMRVSGSTNDASGTRVGYSTNTIDGQTPVAFTMEEMCQAFGVAITAPKPGGTVAKDPRRIERGRAGARAVGLKRLRWIEALADQRGGYATGCRHHAALIWAKSLFDSCRLVEGTLVDDNGEVVSMADRVDDFIEGCCRRDDKMPLHSAVLHNDRYRRLKWKDSSIIELLGITDSEARLIGCPTGAEAALRVEAKPQVSRADATGRRRELVYRTVKDWPKKRSRRLPTLRQVQETVAAVLGLKPSLTTLTDDWDCLAELGRLPTRPSLKRIPETN